MNPTTPFQSKYSHQDVVLMQQRIADEILHKSTWIHVLGLTNKIAGALLPDLWKMIGDYCRFEHVVPTISELEELLVQNKHVAGRVSYMCRMFQLSVEDYFKLPILQRTPRPNIHFKCETEKTNQRTDWLIASQVHDHQGIYHARMRFIEKEKLMLVITAFRTSTHGAVYSCHTIDIQHERHTAVSIFVENAFTHPPTFSTEPPGEAAKLLTNTTTTIRPYQPSDPTPK